MVTPISCFKIQTLEETGFVNVIAEDRSQHFESVLKAELLKAKAMKEEFIRVS